MNKTLMLVICDFLLLSYARIGTFDPPEEASTTLDATASSDGRGRADSLLEESQRTEFPPKSD